MFMLHTCNDGHPVAIKVHKVHRRAHYTPIQEDLPRGFLQDRLTTARKTVLQMVDGTDRCIDENWRNDEGNVRPPDFDNRLWVGFTEFFLKPAENPQPSARPQPTPEMVKPHDAILQMIQQLDLGLASNSVEGSLWICLHAEVRTAFHMPGGISGPNTQDVYPLHMTRIIPDLRRPGIPPMIDRWDIVDFNKTSEHTKQMQFLRRGFAVFMEKDGPITRDGRYDGIVNDTDYNESRAALKPKMLPEPYEPSMEEREKHNRTHLPYRC